MIKLSGRARTPEWYQTHNLDKTSFFPIEYYIERMKNNQYFSRPAWGDNEYRLMIEEPRTVNMRGGVLRPEILEVYLQGAAYIRENKDDMLFASWPRKNCWGYLNIKREGNETGLRVFDLIEKVGLKNYRWHDSLLFRRKILEGEFYPFIEQINKMHLVIAAPAPNRILKEKGIDYDHWIDMPKDKDISYGIDYKEYILEKCLEYGKPGVYLICCGDGSAWLSVKLHKKIPNSFIYDFGKGLDYMSGWKYWSTDIPNTKDPVKRKEKQQEFYKRIASNLQKG